MSRSDARSVAELVVDFLVARNVDRVFGLSGGHIRLMWDQLVQRRVRIIDVRSAAQGSERGSGRMERTQRDKGAPARRPLLHQHQIERPGNLDERHRPDLRPRQRVRESVLRS